MAATWVQNGKSYTSVQALTESAPAATGEGVDLTGVAALTLILSADEGQTLTGGASAGFVDVYAIDAIVGRWAQAPLLTFDVPATAAGLRDVVLGTITIDNPRGRLAPICRAVTVSAGGATLHIGVTTPLYSGRTAA